MNLRILRLAAVCFALPALALAEPCGIRQTATWAGRCYGSIAHDSLVISAIGTRIVILDPESRPRLQEVGSFQVGRMRALAAHGSAIYATTEFGTHVISIADPHEPVHVGYVEHATIPFAEVVQYPLTLNDHLFIPGVDAGTDVLTSIDLSNPAGPQIAGVFQANADEHFVDFGTNAAYFSSTSGVLRKYVLDAGVEPQEVWEAVLPTQTTSVAEYGSYIYVATRHSAYVIDESIPDSLVITTIDAIPDANGAQCRVVDDRLFLANRSGLTVYDLYDPALPSGGYGIPRGQSIGVVAVGTNVLLSSDRGVELFDWSVTSSPRRIGRFQQGGGYYQQILGFEGGAYVVGVAGGMATLNLTDPTNVVVASHFNIEAPDAGRCAAQIDNRLYLSTDYQTYVLDISEPLHPISIGTWREIAADSMIAFDGKLAIVTDNHLRLIDPSAATSPVVLADIELEGMYVRVLASRGGFLYMRGSDPDFFVVDAREPTNPIVYAVPTLAQVRFFDFVIDGDIAYGAADGLVVVDLSDPSTPRRLGRIGNWSIDSVAVIGDRIFGTSFNQRLRQYEVRESALPLPISVSSGYGIGIGYTVHRAGELLLSQSEFDGIRVLMQRGGSADTDFDGDVDLADLARVLAEFGRVSADGTTDFTCDGRVGLEDLAELLSQFGM